MNNKAYINIIRDVLQKKSSLLKKLIDLTASQDECISAAEFDFEKFDKIIEQKSVLIDEVNELDTGFEQLYNNFKQELSENREKYREEIVLLQDLIGAITNESIKLQSMEEKNKTKVEMQLANGRQKIKKYQLSNKTVTSYYKNMNSQYNEQSYFLDKKK